MLVDESFFKSLLDFIDFDRSIQLEYSDIDHARNFALENIFTVKSQEVDSRLVAHSMIFQTVYEKEV